MFSIHFSHREFMQPVSSDVEFQGTVVNPETRGDTYTVIGNN